MIALVSSLSQEQQQQQQQQQQPASKRASINSNSNSNNSSLLRNALVAIAVVTLLLFLFASANNISISVHINVPSSSSAAAPVATAVSGHRQVSSAPPPPTLVAVSHQHGQHRAPPPPPPEEAATTTVAPLAKKKQPHRRHRVYKHTQDTVLGFTLQLPQQQSNQQQQEDLSSQQRTPQRIRSEILRCLSFLEARRPNDAGRHALASLRDLLFGGQQQLTAAASTAPVSRLDHEHEIIVQAWSHLEAKLPNEGTLFRAATACLRGGGLGVDVPHSASHWAKRAGDSPSDHPFFFPLHGGVSPRRVVLHALRSAEYLGIPSAAAAAESAAVSVAGVLALVDGGVSLTRRRVVVDLGCGHGAMLAAMCPPHPNLWCYGVDFTDALIKKGQRAFPHLDLRPGVSAPHLPSGVADSVLSNGVAGMVKFSENCAHFREILRLLAPRSGVGMIWQLSTTRWGRFHPSYFGASEAAFADLDGDGGGTGDDGMMQWQPVAVDPTTATATATASAASTMMKNSSSNRDGDGDGDGDDGLARESTTSSSSASASASASARRVMGRCPGELWRYIDRVDIIADDPAAPLYTPTWASREQQLEKWTGCFGVRIFRNSVPFPFPQQQQQQQQDESSSSLKQQLKPPAGLEKLFSSRQQQQHTTASYTQHYDTALKLARRCDKKEHKRMSGSMNFRAIGAGWCPMARVDVN